MSVPPEPAGMVAPACAGRQSWDEFRDARLTLVGAAAFPPLASGIVGRVLAAFERSFYVEWPDGALACVGGPSIGAGPLNVLLDREIVTPTAGAPFAALIGGLGDAVVWTPPTASGRARRLNRLAARAPIQGLGAMLRPGGGDSGEPLLRVARAAAAALTGWLDDPHGPPPDRLDDLIGLGPGLTPAGDDLLGGALIALRVAGRPAVADRLAAWLLPRTAARTSRISRAHIEAAATLGQGHAALHETLAALCDDDDAALATALGRLDRVGHSSGWDALTGAVLALGASGRRGSALGES